MQYVLPDLLDLGINSAVDGHVHTKYCGHAFGEMEEYVQAALAYGLKQLIFLEHLEVGITYFESTWLNELDFEHYRQEGLLLQEKYAGRISIGLGVEVGYNADFLPEINSLLAKYKWDRIGISYHFLAHDGKHINLLSRKKENLLEFASIGVRKVLRHYLQGLLEAVKKIPGTVLCHLDAALRHHPQVCYEQEHLQLIDEIIMECAAREIAIEVNTSGFALRGEPFPSQAILQMAKKRGVQFVAGSDAHRPQDVGRYFDHFLATR